MRTICILLSLLLFLPPACMGDLRTNYKRYTTDMTWKDAQSYCRLHHNDLITFRDEIQNQVLFSGWIGLYRTDSSSQWKWSRGDQIANFTSWGHTPRIDANCVYKYRTLWYSDYCHYKRYFTCNEERLILVKRMRTWEVALNYCRGLEAIDPSKSPYYNQNNRYDLATLITKDDYVFAQEKAQSSKYGVWTGLRYLAGQWMWVDGEPVQYNHTGRCQTQRCGLLRNGTLITQDCTKKRYFFCYKKI